MTRITKLKKLMAIFNDEKTFIIDGYYRIRTKDKHTIELAYLVAGPCGETIVHPQITVSLSGPEAIGTKLIDMQTSPPKILNRDFTTEREIDTELDALIERFSQIAKKNKKISR